jgi:hypothetical protein
MLFEMKWAEPSAMPMLMPPGCMLRTVAWSFQSSPV